PTVMKMSAAFTWIMVLSSFSIWGAAPPIAVAELLMVLVDTRSSPYKRTREKQSASALVRLHTHYYSGDHHHQKLFRNFAFASNQVFASSGPSNLASNQLLGA